SSSSSLVFFFTKARNSTASSSASPRALRHSLSAAFKKEVLLTPGISTGYWKARKTQASARSSGLISRRSAPLKTTAPPVTSYSLRPASTWARVLLPLPLGPMIAWTSPALTCKLRFFKMGLPSTPAHKLRISSMSLSVLNPDLDPNPNRPRRSTDASFEADTQQFLGLDRKFHRQVLEYLLAVAVDNHINGVLRRNAALIA